MQRMVSFRHFLQRWPRQARFFVLALALMQFVAPTWHVCALGGHVMEHQSMTAHSGMAMPAVTAPDGPETPLICYCAPKPSHHPDPDATQLSPTVSESHATCLALLLQTMPGNFAATPALFLVSTSFVTRPQVAEEFPTLAALRYYQGRAPPRTL